MSGRMARLAFARLRYSAIFDSECVIWRNGTVMYGNPVPIPCTVGVSQDNNQQIDGQNVPVGAFIIRVPVTYTLEQGDYVDERGRRLEIVRTATPKSYEVIRQGWAIAIGDAP